jgi:hypothetical protein
MNISGISWLVTVKEETITDTIAKEDQTHISHGLMRFLKVRL